MCVWVAGGLFIQNARGIQIGSNNTLSIRDHESHSRSASSLSNGANSHSLLKETLQMNGKNRILQRGAYFLKIDIFLFFYVMFSTFSPIFCI